MSRSVDAYIAKLAPAQVEAVRVVRGLVGEAAPEARLSIKWAQPVWEVNRPVCSIKAFESYSNINFWRGAELAERSDPDRLLLGDGDKIRHIRLASVEDVRPEALQRLVREGVELNRRFGDPTRGTQARAR